MNPKYRVTLTEHERGWGSRPFHDEDHDTKEAAEAYRDKINGENTAKVVPDEYTTASDPYFVDADANPPM